MEVKPLYQRYKTSFISFSPRKCGGDLINSSAKLELLLSILIPFCVSRRLAVSQNLSRVSRQLRYLVSPSGISEVLLRFLHASSTTIVYGIVRGTCLQRSSSKQTKRRLFFVFPCSCGSSCKMFAASSCCLYGRFLISNKMQK